MKVLGQAHVTKADVELGQFNGGQHTFLELEPGEWQTISVKLPNGKFVTFAFVPGVEPTEFECVDIHTTVGPRVPRKDSPSSPGFLQHLIGFTVGRNTFTTRKDDQAPTTLATLLLNEKHYKNEQSQRQSQALIK